MLSPENQVIARNQTSQPATKPDKQIRAHIPHSDWPIAERVTHAPTNQLKKLTQTISN